MHIECFLQRLEDAALAALAIEEWLDHQGDDCLMSSSAQAIRSQGPTGGGSRTQGDNHRKGISCPHLVVVMVVLLLLLVLVVLLVPVLVVVVVVLLPLLLPLLLLSLLLLPPPHSSPFPPLLSSPSFLPFPLLMYFLKSQVLSMSWLIPWP